MVKQFSRTQPAGKLVGTKPAAGATLQPGATVQLIVSAGFPALSFDSGGKVHVVSGATGKPQGTSPSAENADEASWSPDGTRLVFIEGVQDAGQIMSITPKSQTPQPTALTAADSNVRDPAVAPNGKVMAFIDRTKGYGRLCFATVGTAAPINTSNCTGNSGYDLGRQISWSADGQHILVFGSKTGNPSKHGMIEFGATVPFSPNASFWDQGSRVTQPAQDVIAGAFAPDGKSVALVSDFGASGFHVFLAPTGVWDVSSPKVRVLANLACQVSWRSDGKALAVMQSGTGCAPDVNGAYPQGNIVTFDLNDPDNEHIVASNAENPAWQPMSLSG
jgi:Tol biopolymer transport system component